MAEFLIPDGERFVPVTVFGYPIAGPAEREDAEEELNRVGLSYLAERWDLLPAACWGSRNTLRWRSSKPSRKRVVVKNGLRQRTGVVFRPPDPPCRCPGLTSRAWTRTTSTPLSTPPRGRHIRGRD